MKEKSKLSLGAIVSLFLSSGTLVCCALPALLVSLGLGATLAGLIGMAPWLVWLSERKTYLFVFAAFALFASHLMQRKSKNLVCATDSLAGQQACQATRHFSYYVLWLATLLYLIGFVFAYALPFFME